MPELNAETAYLFFGGDAVPLRERMVIEKMVRAALQEVRDEGVLDAAETALGRVAAQRVGANGNPSLEVQIARNLVNLETMRESSDPLGRLHGEMDARANLVLLGKPKLAELIEKKGIASMDDEVKVPKEFSKFVVLPPDRTASELLVYNSQTEAMQAVRHRVGAGESGIRVFEFDEARGLGDERFVQGQGFTTAGLAALESGLVTTENWLRREASRIREVAELVIPVSEIAVAESYLNGRREAFNSLRDEFLAQHPDRAKDLPEAIQVDQIRMQQAQEEQSRQQSARL